MSMKEFVDGIIKSDGSQFSILRNGETHTERGAPNTLDGRACFCFMSDADIQMGDWLENTVGNRYFVIDVEMELRNSIPQFLKVWYETAAQHAQVTKATNVFNVQSAYGSIFGNQGSATINYDASISELKAMVSADASADKADMERIISLLEMIVDGQISPSKGILAKFSSIMERHSWLANAVASTILSWLLSQSPLP